MFTYTTCTTQWRSRWLPFWHRCTLPSYHAGPHLSRFGSALAGIHPKPVWVPCARTDIAGRHCELEAGHTGLHARFDLTVPGDTTVSQFP